MAEEKIFQVDGLGKIQVNKVKEALRTMRWESKAYIEVFNRLEAGELKEDRSRYVNMFGPEGPAFGEERDRLFERFAKITAANYQEFLEEAGKSLETIKAAAPVVDKRKSLEELEATAEKFRIQEEAAAKKNAEFDAAAVTIAPGKMAITLEECFDDSDMMTDYFHPHASLGPEYVLAIVKAQSETERLARSIVSRIPALAGVDFQWRTEKYSMGHGNYLEAKGCHREVEHKAYDGREKVGAHWEVQFCKGYGTGRSLLPHPDYFLGDLTELRPDPANGNGHGAVSEKTVRENKEKGGVEILFPSKPDPEILDKLKANGWRWSRFAGLWYNRNTPENLEFAKSL
jgi:hypothetical protein